MLVDAAHASPMPFEDRPSRPDELVRETPNGIGFVAAASSFYPVVRVTIQETEPETPVGLFDGQASASLRIRSGRASVSSILGDVALNFALAPGRWCIRCSVRGREQARRRADDGDVFFYGEEEWLLQLWPAD